MPQVNIHEAKTHLSRLVKEAAKGKEIVIAIAGKPAARLVPLEAAPAKKRKPVRTGTIRCTRYPRVFESIGSPL